MRFTKMEGLGNDYIYLNCLEETPEDLPALAVRLSDRHFGVGADGLVVEVHNDPPHAKCDGAQSLTPEKFRHLMDRLNPLIGLMGKKLV